MGQAGGPEAPHLQSQPHHYGDTFQSTGTAALPTLGRKAIRPPRNKHPSPWPGAWGEGCGGGGGAALVSTTGSSMFKPLPFLLVGLSLASQNSGIPEKWQARGKGDQGQGLNGTWFEEGEAPDGETLA